MKSSALVFFAALMSYLMPVLGAFYYNCEEALILKTAVAQRVGAKHQQLVAQGLRPDQFQAGSTFGQVTYDMISAIIDISRLMNSHSAQHLPMGFGQLFHGTLIAMETACAGKGLKILQHQPGEA
ncbi:putative candidate secreted effector protein [Blumeria hordei DH14]|uniref:Putative candidate secreted effector protein n=1 Tax=Blumeria graminis f. sp. hordei (strain DH14) TaxID=546991 RepID=N1JJD2_BLUG1|nr:putative candidate secreted effector protein [Blumeria hordei DH14]